MQTDVSETKAFQHKRRRDVEPEIEANRAPVARENKGDPAPQERQDVEMLVDTPGESASVKRGSDAVADTEERARLRLRAAGKKEARNTIYKTYWNPRPRRRPGKSRGGVRRVKARNLSQNWRKRSRRQFQLRVALLQFREARARGLTFLLILLWLRA